MERPRAGSDAGPMAAPDTSTVSVSSTPTVFHPDPEMIRRALRRRSVATLSTVSPAGRPHAATVVYQLVDDTLFVSTHRMSRKARNVAAHPFAAVVVAVRRFPVGPPASVQFQGPATVIAHDDAEIIALVGAGRLDRITAHGELQLDGGCFLRVELPRRAVTYALGMPLWRVLRNPLDTQGEVHLTIDQPSASPGPR